MDPRPSDYAAIVRAHHAATTGYVAAQGEDCLSIRDEEIARIRRKLEPLALDQLAKVDTGGSWLLGVILCPGDDVTPLARWVARSPQAVRRRVRLYAHPDVDLVDALAPWYAADLDDPRVHIVSDFATFHRRFGNDLNDQVYEDAQGLGR